MVIVIDPQIAGVSGDMLLSSLVNLGADKNKRDQYKDHKYYNDCVKFCELWDQSSFDPKYKSLKLEEFEPLIRKIFSRKPYTFL